MQKHRGKMRPYDNLKSCQKSLPQEKEWLFFPNPKSNRSSEVPPQSRLGLADCIEKPQIRLPRLEGQKNHLAIWIVNSQSFFLCLMCHF